MCSLDHRILMSLKLDRWSEPHELRKHEIERELLAAHYVSSTIRNRRRGMWISKVVKCARSCIRSRRTYRVMKARDT